MTETMTPESSSIAAVAYDPETAALTVHLRRGAAYCYFLVPPDVHRALLAAGSKRVFFNTFIRPVYRYAKL